MITANTAPAGTPAEHTTTHDDTALYFVVAISLCAISLLPPVLARLGVLPGPADQYMVAAPLAVFSPTIASVVAIRVPTGAR